MKEVVLHKGTFKKTATVSQAVFMITGLTIGAGVFGLPYAIAQLGLIPGLLLLLFIGLIMLGINLMVGEITLASGDELQLPGLAGKYLGGWAKALMSGVIVISWFGTLLAYLVGEGQALAGIFGGSELLWGIIFWSLASFMLWGGLSRLKKIDQIISAVVILFLVVISLAIIPNATVFNATLFNPANLFAPIGVIIFALHATPAIAEVHALVRKPSLFRRAIIWGTAIPVAVYMLFVAAVVLVTGTFTTEVATIGIGTAFGPFASIIANLVAILAMLTCYLGLGNALQETFTWDHAISERLSLMLVITIPLMLFLLGFRNFILILNVVGGVFIAIEICLLVLIYLKMRHQQHKKTLR